MFRIRIRFFDGFWIELRIQQTDPDTGTWYRYCSLHSISAVDPDPNWTRNQQLRRSESVVRIQIRIHTHKNMKNET